MTSNFKFTILRSREDSNVIEKKALLIGNIKETILDLPHNLNWRGKSPFATILGEASACSVGSLARWKFEVERNQRSGGVWGYQTGKLEGGNESLRQTSVSNQVSAMWKGQMGILGEILVELRFVSVLHFDVGERPVTSMPCSVSY